MESPSHLDEKAGVYLESSGDPQRGASWPGLHFGEVYPDSWF